MTDFLSAALADLAAAAGSQDELRAVLERIAAQPGRLQGAEADAFNRVAGALLQQAGRFEQAASEHGAVMTLLDRLHRDLDSAQRSEWVAHERMRIAQELHDRVAQTLFGIGLKAEWLLMHLEKDEHLRSDLERVKQLAGTGLRQVRESIFSLSSGPVEAAHLRSAIQALLGELENAGIDGDLRTTGDLERIPADVSDGLYQVVREALVNVRRHSEAKTVLVSLRTRPDEVTAVIQDDGKGLPPAIAETYRLGGAHLGLRGMESRVTRLGGALTLAPGDECGLVVTVRIPLKAG